MLSRCLDLLINVACTTTINNDYQAFLGREARIVFSIIKASCSPIFCNDIEILDVINELELVAFSHSTPLYIQGAVLEVVMKTSLAVYIERDVVKEMHKRHLKLSLTTELALRGLLFPEQSEKKTLEKIRVL
ncbi:hypothetical protein [Acidiplasma aeolicum]|uniref:hypothetical protein n=1 Tax=Acidiplasma aeolicum TaxID=507754 RepID=UPI003713AD13